ncbi:MAG: hypothetical protein NXH87_14640 [Rhodobiaceae bacterium]|nr:hypothetical protein RHODOSMS8_03262 [Rhodobiaceae bacterium]MCR9242614.1 hypothetical protein [Rhodobiaceae bacterium]
MAETVQELQARRDALLQMCIWQDHLLQSYRSINLMLQSFLLIVLAALVAIPSVLDFDQSAIFHLLTVVAAFPVTGVIWFTNSKIQEIILARGGDVSYVHKRVVRVENTLPVADRVFTEFKIVQGGHGDFTREEAEKLFLSDQSVTVEDVEKLITGRLGFARRVIDRNLFDGIRIAAVLLLVTKILILIAAIVQWQTV